MDDVPDYERKAAELIWQHEGHTAKAFGDLPVADQARLLKVVRAREMQIQTHVTHDMLDRSLSEGRRFPRRHQIVALIFLGGVFGAGILAAGIVSMVQSCGR